MYVADWGSHHCSNGNEIAYGAWNNSEINEVVCDLSSYLEYGRCNLNCQSVRGSLLPLSHSEPQPLDLWCSGLMFNLLLSQLQKYRSLFLFQNRKQRGFFYYNISSPVFLSHLCNDPIEKLLTLCLSNLWPFWNIWGGTYTGIRSAISNHTTVTKTYCELEWHYNTLALLEMLYD